jgi:hypothetical protein
VSSSLLVFIGLPDHRLFAVYLRVFLLLIVIIIIIIDVVTVPRRPQPLFL